MEFRKESQVVSGGEDPTQRLMLQMMDAFAQFECSMIRERQREGIAAAKKAGKPIGRPSGLDHKQLKSLKAKRTAGETVKQLQDEFNHSRASVYRLTV